jgi:hypothetical protein
VTAYVCPPMVVRPTRAAPLFADTVSVTVALALPVCPDVIAIQASPLDALHAQPVSVVMSTVRRPPPAPIESPLRLNRN